MVSSKVSLYRKNQNIANCFAKYNPLVLELLKITATMSNWDKFQTKASSCRSAICSLGISCTRWRARGWTLLPFFFQLLVFLGFLIPFAGSFPTRLAHCTGKFGSLQKISEHQTIADECQYLMGANQIGSAGCPNEQKSSISYLIGALKDM